MNRVLLCALALAVSAACTPKVGIIRPRPATVNLAPAKRLTIKVSGRDYQNGEPPLAVGLLIAQGGVQDPDYPVRQLQTRVSQTFQSGYFTLTSPENAQCGVHVKVVDWSHGEDTYTPEKTKENPHPATSLKLTGRLDAQASIACGHLGAQPILRTYTVRQELKLPAQTATLNDHEKLIDSEVATLTHYLHNEITPATYGEEVVLDDSDDAVEYAVERIQVGEFDTAYGLLENVVKQKPNCAAAHYNLGVIEETRGELDKAHARYTEAKRLKSNALYDQGLARVERVRGEMKALAGASVP